ncbi:hypothetical protein BG011_003109 [Mortierella polycephala]|uniref:Uncharacterized protein n=1 Tax=Mortierella polycephala TaxID=41804 RepID=A0A9P6U4G3_9FUNG|nr:hypothetical protein BG011_003109 [Mortierella polycephala]
MHVTCAQNDALMTKGKGCQLFCDLHRDIGVLNRIMNRPPRQDRSSSSTPAPSAGRSTKRNQSYRESEDDDDNHSDGDEELLNPTTSDSEDDYRRRRSSATSSLNSRRHSKNKRSLDSDEQFVKDESSDSEEIDVDDSEAVLGSSAGGRSTSMNQRKQTKSATIGPKESAAESQRRRLLKTLDMNKKRRSSGGLNNVTNLSNIPIRTLGGIGLAASTLSSGSGGESKQKLPGISRHGLNNNPSGFDSLSKTKPGGSSVSPSLGSSERFSNVGGNPNSGRGSVDGSVKNKKGLTFELDPAMDVGVPKGVTVFAGSVTPSPVISNFSNSASPVQTRLGERQQASPKMGYGPFTDETREQPTIQSLLGKVASLENTIQVLTHQKQQLQQQLATANTTAPSSGSSSSAHTPSSSISAPSTATSSALLQANPHTIGPPGQDLQYRFDALEHAFAEEKMNSASLRENLRDIFGVLQLTVKSVGTDEPQGDANNDEIAWNTENLDTYVQTLRDAVVGPETPPSLDSKQVGQIVDRVIGELVKPSVSAT